MGNSIKLYIDEDAMRVALVQALRARDIDVITAHDAALMGQPDEVQLDFATQQNRVLFSFNRGHFVKLHIDLLNAQCHHSGIIVSDQLDSGTLLRRMLKLLYARTDTDMVDWLEFLSNWR